MSQPQPQQNGNQISSEDKEEWTVIEPESTGGSDLDRGELIDLNDGRPAPPPPKTEPQATPPTGSSEPETRGGLPPASGITVEAPVTTGPPKSGDATIPAGTDGTMEPKKAKDAITEQIGNVSLEDFWQKEEERFGPIVVERTGASGERIPVTITGTSVPGPSVPPAANNEAPKPGKETLQTSLHETVQKSDEMYAVKHIRWLDPGLPPNSPENPRTTQILLQNENGPCPLLALVNALMLSTPPGYESALVRTLKLRETVSLGLLLDAVFDELMSRSGGLGESLDVSEVFAFLMTLHTGMNVNPDFTADSVTGAGSFEQTKEISLYSAFNVPLVHGWLPEPGSEALKSFTRSAKTYEDSQTLILGEEELLQRLTSQIQTADDGLSVEQRLQDVERIRDFLERHSTQLTPYGLKRIFDSLNGVGIMFRNDHFATVLRLPTTFAHTARRPPTLLTLVTDAGFGSYEEVVFETLVSVNGEGGEFLSGDYRPVGGLQGQDHRRREGPRNTSQPLLSGGPAHSPDLAPARHSSMQPTGAESHDENTDYDLALAISLQEEEDNIARRARTQSQSQSPPERFPPPSRPPPGDALPSYDEVVASNNAGRNRAASASNPAARRGQQARSMLDEFDFQNRGSGGNAARPGRQSLPASAFQQQQNMANVRPGPNTSDPGFQRPGGRPPPGGHMGGGGGSAGKKDCVIM